MASGRIKAVILPTAKVDLRAIVNFIAQDSRKYVLIEKQLIIGAIDKLCINLDLGTMFDYRGIEARQFVFRKYLIIYRLKTEKLLEILTIHHHDRLLSNNPAFRTDDG